MLLGGALGQFTLGQTTDISVGVLVATEAADTATFVGEGHLVGILVATEAADTATFVAYTATVGELAATEAPDTASFIGQAHPFGVLDATEEADQAHFDGVAYHGLIGVLDATEGADTAEMRAWALPYGRCLPKTVCVVAVQGKTPDLVGSQGDKDTQTCREWDTKRAA